MKRPAWLKRGARVMLLGRVVLIQDDAALVDLGCVQSWERLRDLGKTWSRAPRVKARSGKAGKP
jgi:hypothetical protein